MYARMRELSSKLEGVETVDVGTLPRRVRREDPDITSPLTKRCSRQILSHFHRFLELRVPRRPRSFAKRVQKWATSKERYHTPLCGYAFSRMKSTPHHPSHALRRHGIAKSLGLLSRPPQVGHSSQQPPRAKVTIISDAPSQSHSIRRAFGFAVAWSFSMSGP